MAGHDHKTDGASCCGGHGGHDKAGHGKSDHGKASHDHAGHDHAHDPVCGMTVDPATSKHRFDFRGVTYHFCSAGCQTKFAAAPERYLDKANAAPQHADVPEGTVYTCPMHPADPSGRTRKLPDLRHGAGARTGQPRRPTQPRAGRHDPALLGRARAGAAGHCTRDGRPSGRLHGWIDQNLSNWMQLVFATPVVLWAGWPFFVRGWQSLKTRNLNMFTLIAMGVGVALPTASWPPLAPGHLPAAFRDATAAVAGLFRGRCRDHRSGPARPGAGAEGARGAPPAPSRRCSISRPRPPAAPSTTARTRRSLSA
jgi:Cu+-exporting ATPase